MSAMKKQFFRVKQLADQTFLRADKSEGLNHDELKKADLKVEYIQKALTEIGKKLPSPSSSSNSNQDLIDKRLKKYEEYGIAQSMLYQLQGENDFSKDMLLQFVLKECGSAERSLATIKMEHELEIGEHVSAPINGILDKDLPNVAKQKKNLNKHILDSDSAKNRYQNARKAGPVKENNLKEDMDEADIKLDQSRDCLAMEMFGLLRREKEICSYFLQFLKMQRSYHENAYKYLHEVIPKLEKTIGEDINRPVFGCPIEEYLELSNLRIAFPLELCAFALMELGGMSEEGLFRVTGSASRVKRLRLSLDSGCFTLPLIPEYRDVHVLASTLKLYLRELPEPLLTYKLYGEWMDAMNHSEERRVAVLQDILKRLPAANRDNLAFLMQFFSKLTKHTTENRMTASNIAIVISPNLLWADIKEEHINMKNCATLNMIVELFINQIEVFFPVDMLKLIKLKAADLTEVDDFIRPDINCLRYSVVEPPNVGEDAASPKPNMRFKKAKPAPAPPIQQQQQHQQQLRSETDGVDNNYYYSAVGTSSLNRPSKLRPDRPSKVDKKEEILLTREDSQKEVFKRGDLRKDDFRRADFRKEDELRRRSLVDDAKFFNSSNLVNNANETPGQAESPQTIETPPNKTASELQEHESPIQIKPVAAPRTTLNHTNSDKVRQEEAAEMSKSLSSIDAVDANGATLRRKGSSDFDEKQPTNKPAIPVRPASLRQPRITDSESGISRNFNIPQQLVNKQNRNLNQSFAMGHDNQISEKEKFLGHNQSGLNHTGGQQHCENKCGDINSNPNKPELPTKPPLMKSNERLNLDSSLPERFNGNGNASNKSSHVRTRSDGNIVDVRHDGTSLLQAPPSPRSLNKPSQPPPPPPTVANKPKPDLADQTATTNL